MLANATRAVETAVADIRQVHPRECGLAVMAMIGQFYGRCSGIDELRPLFPLRDGMGLLVSDLLPIAAYLKLEAEVFWCDPVIFPLLRLPVIVVLTTRQGVMHVVVITRITAKDVEFNDPMSGQRILTRAEFTSLFTGVTCEVYPQGAFARRRPLNRLHTSRVAEQTPVDSGDDGAWDKSFKALVRQVQIGLSFELTRQSTLWRWLKAQDEGDRTGALTGTQKLQLQSIGYIFHATPLMLEAQTWALRCAELKRLTAITPIIELPPPSRRRTTMDRWIPRQQLAIKNNTLIEARQRQLQLIAPHVFGTKRPKSPG